MIPSPVRTVEIGHTYAPYRLLPLNVGADEYGQRMFSDTPKAAHMRELASNLGAGTLRVALLDDVVVAKRERESEENSWRWSLFTGTSEQSLQIGTGAEIVQRESQLEPEARRLIEQIRTMDLPEGYRLSQDGRKIITGTGDDRFYVPLEGYHATAGGIGTIDDPTHPSCQMLDLAWLRKRLAIAPDAVTVLPDTEWYRRQQRGVEILSRLFPDMHDAHIETIFTPENTSVDAGS